MLATAYDIVTRLPEADEARIREELSGNLCRCTGYVGIVAAIKRRAGATARMHSALVDRARHQRMTAELARGPLRRTQPAAAASGEIVRRAGARSKAA